MFKKGHKKAVLMNSDDTTNSGVILSDQRCWPEPTQSLSTRLVQDVLTTALTTAIKLSR